MKVIDFIGDRVVFYEHGNFIWSIDKDGGHQRLLDLKFRNVVLDLFKTNQGEIDEEAAMNFQDKLGKWITDAINEKLENERLKKEINLNETKTKTDKNQSFIFEFNLAGKK
jgi:hypothetical protein